MVSAGSAAGGAAGTAFEHRRQQLEQLGVRLLAPHQPVDQLERRLGVRETLEIRERRRWRERVGL
jgi:hypothetical protein